MSNYTLEDARKYAESIGNAKQVQVINPVDVVRSLGFLANAKDEIAFRKIVDFYVKFAEANPSDLVDEPLAFLEWLCMANDHSFSAIGTEALYSNAGIVRERLETKATQTFFQKLYGAHFYYPKTP